MIDTTRGKLTVIKINNRTYIVECKCGYVFKTYKSRWDNYSGKGCRKCYSITKDRDNPNYRHGGNTANKLEYNSWRAMRERCNKPRYRRYDRYGGRGIKVCPQWNDPKTGFMQFLSDMGKKPSPKHSIDRIDNDGDYTPGNCRWVLQSQQTRNSTAVRECTVDGITAPIIDHCKRYGISAGIVSQRINTLGWSAEKAITTPAGKIGSNQFVVK